MNILVIGCGRVGSQLSNMLCEQGHDVAVIDSNPDHFDRLSDDFTGYTLKGIPIDQDTLRRAGIDGCDALVAATEDDNMNVMVCQIAGEMYHVPRVLARVNDPRRGDVFSRFGLHTICPTNLSVHAIFSMLTDHDPIKNIYFDAATLTFDQTEVDPELWGCKLGTLCEDNSSSHSLFGLLHPDGNVTLAHVGSTEIVGQYDRLLYVTVVD